MRTPLVVLLAALLAAPLSVGSSPASHVPAVLEGHAVAPLVPLPAATSIVFGPGDGDGPDLYATVLAGDVLRVALSWTPAGPVASGVTTYAGGFSQPLGLEFDAAGNLYVSDSHEGVESGGTDGRVTRVTPEGARLVLVDGLPNGRHNTNNLRWGPDGRLYVANGNPNDSGPESGEADVFPYSGAILGVDVAEVAASPAVLHWRDAAGARIPAAGVASHPRNADFAQKVSVLGYGFRNVYDVAFSPAGDAYTATNGADNPSSQDLLYKVTPGADHGFPFCYNLGAPGAVGEDVAVAPNPLFPDADCSRAPRATALLGWHVCATGLDFPTGPGWGEAVYVAECGPFWADSLVPRTLEDPASAPMNTGHKVVRVTLDAAGEAVEVRDFLTGLALPTDVRFGPDDALYVADVEMVHRVARAVPAAPAEHAPAARVVAGPFASGAGFATRALVVPQGSHVTFTNADILRHNVIARNAFGPDERPWCGPYAEGRCPLFWSASIGTGETPVLGVEGLAPGTYEFHCTLHANGMQGTLVVASS